MKMRRATLAVIVKNGQVLLGYKKKEEIGTGTWNGPGGKIEDGETSIECVIRETEDELGIRLIDPTLTAVIYFYAGGECMFEAGVYRATEFEGEPTETDVMIPKWFPKDNLPLNKMLESDHKWFQKAVQGEKFGARVYYKEIAKEFDRIEFFDFPESV